MPLLNNITWPDGKSFAFTIFDDTDYSTLDNTVPVYKFLSDYGFRTTKSIWPIKGTETPRIGGSTCEDTDYLNWINRLRDNGFEIALHNATYHTSTRHDTIRGIDRFKELFSDFPSSHANHSGCDEGVYWGDARLTGLNRLIYNILTMNKNKNAFKGHVEDSFLFWGDICREQIKYVRNFVFDDINTLNACPYMPYFDKKRPYVNNWFASSEGAKVESFCDTIIEKNQDRLVGEGGACIMYTHLACGFYTDGKLNPRFKELMKRLSKLNGWFVPVSTLLDYIIEQRGEYTLTDRDRNKLERKWLLHKIRFGHS